jgi:hypothetical protein
MLRILVLCVIGLISGCSGGAVVFAPTPLPPDVSPLRYDHPGGAFSVIAPRTWPVYEQNTTVLASAAFSPPSSDQPTLHFAVVNLGERIDSARLGEIIDQYQTQLRPDSDRYTEVDRGAMGDGSWRLTGLRHTVGGETEQVNTFIQQTGSFLAVIEVLFPEDAGRRADLQTIVNTFSINQQAALEPTTPDVLAYAAGGGLDLLHVFTWTTPGGVFFVTGEVANTGPALVADVPVRAVLKTGDGLAVAEAVDTVMGYGIPPGGYAPFSLRFGQGQPALTTTFELSLGGLDWTPLTGLTVYSADDLTWTDESVIGADGSLTVTGRVTNTGSDTVRSPRAVVTVFDTTQSVIAAGFAEVTNALSPGASAEFRLLITEMGGYPANYIVTVQGLP